jgi:D-xylose transport system permease protein
MSTADNTRPPGGSPALEGQEEQPTLLDYVRGYFERIRSGDLGSLPIIIGLVIIAIIFQSQNENYLTPRNLVSLILQMAGYAVIAYGIVFVLLLGEIDLSVSYISAVAGVVVVLLVRPPGEWHWLPAIGLALFTAGSIGFLQGLIITYFQVPAFVVTLAGFLAWNGVVLVLIGTGGTIILQDRTIIDIANSYLPPESIWGYVAALLFIGGYILDRYLRRRSRQQRGLQVPPLSLLAAQFIGMTVIGFALVFIVNQDRGVPVIGLILLIMLIILTLITERTRFGRYVYAVGGNAEAARRAGINVTRIRIAVFTIAGFMAGMGGIVLASRLRSVSTEAGGGNLLLNSIAAAVIGGTSLFGGRGHVSSALLGALVIASVENGMGLLGLSAGNKFIITGLVLLIAVIVDSLSRRRQQRTGVA